MSDPPPDLETDLFLALHVVHRWLRFPTKDPPPLHQLDVLRTFVARTDTVVAAVIARDEDPT